MGLGPRQGTLAAEVAVEPDRSLMGEQMRVQVNLEPIHVGEDDDR
jgi:hypothetical protein